MAWARLWFHFDRRFLVAALGAASAILLPVAATLVLSGLAPVIDDDAGWLLVDENGLDLGEGVRRAVWYGEVDGMSVASITHGDPLVAVGQAGSLAGNDVVLAGKSYAGLTRASTELIPDGAVLLHPDDLSGAPMAAWLDHQAPGAVAARGADAFEQLGIESLSESFWLLILVSMPATILVASAFADQEVRERARSAATFAALGAPEMARRILGFRVLSVAGAAGFMAAAIGGGLWLFGGATFHPADTPVVAVFFAVALPTLAAAGAGLTVVWWRLRDVASLLQGSGEGDLPGPHLPIPIQARPLALGVRLVPVILLAASLFVVDLGFPLAAAQIPAAIAGQGDEWVDGAESDISIGGAVDAGPGNVLRYHPDVDDALAEIVLPTTINGKAVLVRGGDWNDLARYHDLELQDGDASEWVIGQRAAKRLNLDIGDTFWTQSSVRPLPHWATVSGIYHASGLLGDEVMAPGDEARELAGLDPGESSVVRVRPASQEALGALQSNAGRIEVVDVAPGPAIVGGVSDISVTLVNVGGAPATRTITVRVDGIPQATETVTLPAFGRAIQTYPVLVAHANFVVDVNPTSSGSAQESDWKLVAPAVQYDNQAPTARLEGENHEGVSVGFYASLNDASKRNALATGVTDAAGEVRWPNVVPGTYYAATNEPFVVAKIEVADGRYQHLPHIVVQHVWIEGPQTTGSLVQIKAQVTNLGGAAGSEVIEYFLDEGRFNLVDVALEPGETKILDARWAFRAGELRVGEHSQTAKAQTSAPSGTSVTQKESVQSASSIQAEVADRVLGDARQALVGMAAIAMASSLSIVYLATDRTLRGRKGILDTLHALGEDAPAIRRRAGWEAALLGSVSFLAAIVVGKILFALLAWIGWPAPFAHTLPDPFGWLFAVQATAAFGAACALAAFLATGPLLKAIDT